MGAFVLPLAKDRVEAWKGWVRELRGPRAEAFEAFNRRMGLSAHRTWLGWGSMGTHAIVVVEGVGEAHFLDRLATETEPFATWYRERLTELHGLDPSKRLEHHSILCVDWAEVPATV